DVISPAMVKAMRDETATRTLPWTEAELREVAGAKAAESRMESVAALRPEPSGEILLSARQARVYGQRLGYRPGLDVLAPWTIAEDMVEWRVDVPTAGRYEVKVTLAADDASAGDFFMVETEGSRARGEVASTSDY